MVEHGDISRMDRQAQVAYSMQGGEQTNGNVVGLRQRLVVKKQAERESENQPKSNLQIAFDEVIQNDKDGEPMTLLATLMQLRPRLYEDMRRVYRGVDVEDLFQELCIKVAQNRNSFNPNKGTFRYWARSIARNIAVDETRRMRSHPQIVESQLRLHSNHDDNSSGSVSFLERIEDVEPLSEDIAIGNMLALDVYKAWKTLSMQQRITTELIMKGLSHREISRRLGKSLGTTKYHARFGLRNLRKQLKDWNPSLLKNT